MTKYLLTALLFSGSAFAAESEFFFQADEDQKFLSVYGDYRTFSSDNSDTDGFLLGVEYERGINEMLSWHVGLDYGMYTNEVGGSETDTDGLSDILFGVKGRHMIGPGSLRFGTTGYLAYADGETDANGDQNRATGGIGLAPYVGYQWDQDPALFGLKVSQEAILAEGKLDDNGTESTVSGGEAFVISAYYERILENSDRFGAALHHTTTSDTETETSGTTTTQEADDALYGLELYGRMDRDNGSWIPSLTYTTSSDDDFDSYDDITLGVKYRMAL